MKINQGRLLLRSQFNKLIEIVIEIYFDFIKICFDFNNYRC